MKLRNADIELRKGETDIGRKNTRVRVVFRVHIPQPSGQYISLQTASHPIECCEFPMTFDLSCVTCDNGTDEPRYTAVKCPNMTDTVM